jgi:arylsulfatase A-like enzyme
MRSAHLLGLLLVLPVVAPVQAADPARPNVIVILADDLGWTDLACFGSDLHRTPNLDRLAREGMRFTHGYSACTVCSPTRAALMTGKYPSRLHITDWIPGSRRANAKLKVPDWTQYLPREEVTIADALKKSGYATASIGKWHLGNKEQGYPDRHGFDINIAGNEQGSPPTYFSPYRIPTLENGPDGEYLTDREGAEAVRFIEANKDRPFFLYLPFHAVHTPLQAKQDLILEYQKLIQPGMRHTHALYAAMVQSLDEAVGRILARLRELKLDERTLVVFTSDNGGLVLRNTTTNIPLRAGKGSVYEGGVRVPWIVKWPGLTPPGSTCEEPIITPDLYPTLLQITGAKGDPKHNAAVDGLSLVPVLKDPKSKLERQRIYWHYPHYHPGGATPYAAVRARDWKLIETYEDNRVELYNLKEDPGEKTDLAAKDPERAALLRETLRAWQREVGAQFAMPAK